MDRTAWIVVTLCVIGLILWTWWTGKQMPLRPAPVPLSATATPLAAPNESAVPSTPPSSVPAASATPVAEATPTFAEKTETLRNDDVELRLTNRGGGIAEAVLVNHIGQNAQRVVINSKHQTPIGADGSVKCERNRDNVAIRKKFFFPSSNEKKDNFVAEMDVDLVNGGGQPYANPGYFIALGAAVPIHPTAYSY